MSDPGGPRVASRGDGDRTAQWAALGRMALIVAAGVLAAVVTGTGRTLAVVLAIVVMIMLHELGHFATAKWAGMKVTEYFLGFGPRLWSFRRGETEYGVKAIPAGGYVKIIGMSNLEEVDPADEPRTYRQAPFWRRVSVVSAGSAMHFLLAFVLLWALLAGLGTIDYNHPKLTIGSLSSLQSGPSPAEKAGLRIGDRIVTVDGRTLRSWDDLRGTVLKHPGDDLALGIVRDGRPLTLHATPVDLSKVKVEDLAPAPSSGPQGFLGVGPSFPVIRDNPGSAFVHAGGDLGRYTWATLGAIKHIFSRQGLSNYTSQLAGHEPPPSANGQPSGGDRFLSPVGIVRLASNAASSGLRDVLVLLITINVFVGIFNMVPLLPLDGGHVAIAVYERIRSRRGRRYRVDVRNWLPVTYFVFLALVVIGVTSIYLDIAHPAPNPFQ